MISLAEKLKNYRKEKNLRQEDLAAQLEVAKSVISDIESGRRTASKKTFQKLAEHSGKSIDWWMNNQEVIEISTPNELETTKLIVEKLINEGMLDGLLVDGEIDDAIARILLNSLKVDIELKLKKNSTEG